MYQLASVPIVVKIARPTIGHVRQVVQLVRWLEQCDVPTVSLWNSIDQPLQVAGCAVTFWRYLPPTSPISAGDSAEPLSALHGIGAPPITVPMYAPLNAIRRSIDASRLLTIEDQKLLKDRCEALSSEADEVQYELPPGVIHGDPQHGNACGTRISIGQCCAIGRVPPSALQSGTSLRWRYIADALTTRPRNIATSIGGTVWIFGTGRATPGCGMSVN